MVGRAGDVDGERNQAADERHEVLPQALGRLGRLVADQLLGGKIKYHLKNRSIVVNHPAAGDNGACIRMIQELLL